MRNDKQLAIKLRKNNKSYNYISKKLGIPKSTLATWFKSKKWSIVIKNLLVAKNNTASGKRVRWWTNFNSKKWAQWRAAAQEEAKKEFKIFIKNPLFIAGIMLYWGEGDSKLKNPVRLANTDPRMIQIYNEFLQKICKIPKEKIRAFLILYPDLSEKKCKEFWMKSSNMRHFQFNKTQYIKGRHPTKRLSYGICSIIVSSRQLKEKIISWIDLFSQMCNNVNILRA